MPTSEQHTKSPTLEVLSNSSEVREKANSKLVNYRICYVVSAVEKVKRRYDA